MLSSIFTSISEIVEKFPAQSSALYLTIVSVTELKVRDLSRFHDGAPGVVVFCPGGMRVVGVHPAVRQYVIFLIPEWPSVAEKTMV
jgi:hypothetical protein